LAELAAVPDDAIDYSDIPKLDETFWEKAKPVFPKRKRAISLRVDDEVYEWFKHQGKGYQSLMNAVLKSYMEARKSV
jgi:uncharacterized protein (DUF4415 family)